MQRTVTGTLNTIVNIVKNEQIENPSMIIIGEVVNVREKIQWFEKEQYYKQLRQEISV